MKNTPPTPTPLVIRRSNLPQIVGFSATTAWRLEAAGKFPKRRKLGPGIVGWLYSELQEWVEKQEVAS